MSGQNELNKFRDALDDFHKELYDAATPYAPKKTIATLVPRQVPSGITAESIIFSNESEEAPSRYAVATFDHSSKYWIIKKADLNDEWVKKNLNDSEIVFKVRNGYGVATTIDKRMESFIDRVYSEKGYFPIGVMPYGVKPNPDFCVEKSAAKTVDGNVIVNGKECAVLFKAKAAGAGRGDMSDRVLSGRLGEICQKRLLKDFPIAYAWPSICAAAGVSVPPIPSDRSLYTQSEAMTTSYTGLVGSVNSGKSQAIAWARKVVGLPDQLHSEVKPGSAESLLLKLSHNRHKGLIGDSVLIDLDEWAFLFNKAKIENSSFSTFLQSAFYKRHHEQTLGNNKEVNFNCAISFIGGIVEDQFDLCFGANTMGGLHDRFTFGLCPDGYKFMYREYEGRPETFEPVPVHIAPEIWEMIASMRKANPKIGREAEIAIRIAHICASFDGRDTLLAKDCESMVQAFISEQLAIRELLKPNAGITTDAQCANALVQWLERNVPNGEMAWERDVRYGLRKTLERLGPGVLEYSTKNLSQQGVIWYGEIANAKAYRGRRPRAYRLMKPAEVEIEGKKP